MKRNKQLLNHAFSTISVSTNDEYLHRCIQTLGCVSVNWETAHRRCHLNNAELSDVSCRAIRESSSVIHYWLDVGGCKC